jgi:hypothetical protein
MSSLGQTPPGRRIIRAPQNFFAGLALIALALFAIWAVSDLSQGTLRIMGPAMMPRWVAIFIGVGGAMLALSGLIVDGEPLERWHLRGPVFITIGLVLFALTIRPFGIAVAGPLAMLFGGFATREVRWIELIIFTIAMTAFCIGLFVYMLDQPIPVLIIPGTGIKF